MGEMRPGRNGGILKSGGATGGGRPKGSLSAKTVIRRWLEAIDQVENPLTGAMESMSQLDIITLKQIEKARRGDTNAFRELLDRTEGKALQSVGMKSETDGQLKIHIVRGIDPPE